MLQVCDEIDESGGQHRRAARRARHLLLRRAAVGAGANLMLAADLRIVGEDARLISGFLKIRIDGVIHS